MTNTYVYRQNPKSGGAKALAKAIGAKLIKAEGSAFVGSSSKTVINWGCGVPVPILAGAVVLNEPEDVGNVTNKRKFFEMMKGTPDLNIPNFTTRREEGRAWVRDGQVLFARTILQGSGGVGIVEVKDEATLDTLPEGTLLVQYIKKKEEYRVHIAHNKVISIQCKKRLSERDDDTINWRIRNVANGFIFARKDITPPSDVVKQAHICMQKTGLDFGAVDVLYNKKQGKAYVLEVNTAPGLEGTTIVHYANHFIKQLNIPNIKQTVDEFDIEELLAMHNIELDTRRGEAG